MKSTKKNTKKKKSPDFIQSGIKDHEDAVLKVSAQYFGDVLLPYFGIKGKVVSYGPTELIHLDLKKQYQDFNFIMEDGRWIHIEFQSTNEGIDGLKRFRVYEATTSYQYKVEVFTYVLYSGNIKNPMTEFTEGLNTYRIHPIIMSEQNADDTIEKLQEKINACEILRREDLVPLMLCPLMSGKSSQKDRIKTAYQITQKATMVDKEELKKIEAVIYAMADKFLDMADLEELKEEVKMTRLGQMLVDEGISQGVRSLVKACKDFGASKEDIIERIMNDFSYTREKAQDDVEKYWC